jgi:hypothetical protein
LGTVVVVIAMNGWWATDELRHGLELTSPKLLLANQGRIERLDGIHGDVPLLSFEDDFESLARAATHKFMKRVLSREAVNPFVEG